MDTKVQFPEPILFERWQEWARQLNMVLNQMIGDSPQDQESVVVLTDKRSSTAGGASVAGAQARVLNTKYDPLAICILKGDSTFELPKGRYFCIASAPGYGVSTHQAYLTFTVGGAAALLGTSEYSPAGGAQTRSWIVGVLQPKETTSYKLMHYTAGAVATNGLGVTGGGNDIFSQVALWGLA